METREVYASLEEERNLLNVIQISQLAKKYKGLSKKQINASGLLGTLGATFSVVGGCLFNNAKTAGYVFIGGGIACLGISLVSIIKLGVYGLKYLKVQNSLEFAYQEYLQSKYLRNFKGTKEQCKKLEEENNKIKEQFYKDGVSMSFDPEEYGIDTFEQDIRKIAQGLKEKREEQQK